MKKTVSIWFVAAASVAIGAKAFAAPAATKANIQTMSRKRISAARPAATAVTAQFVASPTSAISLNEAAESSVETQAPAFNANEAGKTQRLSTPNAVPRAVKRAAATSKMANSKVASASKTTLPKIAASPIVVKPIAVKLTVAKSVAKSKATNLEAKTQASSAQVASAQVASAVSPETVNSYIALTQKPDTGRRRVSTNRVSDSPRVEIAAYTNKNAVANAVSPRTTSSAASSSTSSTREASKTSSPTRVVLLPPNSGNNVASATERVGEPSLNRDLTPQIIRGAATRDAATRGAMTREAAKDNKAISSKATTSRVARKPANLSSRARDRMLLAQMEADLRRARGRLNTANAALSQGQRQLMKVSSTLQQAMLEAGGEDTKGLHPFVRVAQRYAGTPYVWGGESRNGFDCSGFIIVVMRDLGYRALPHSAAEQFNYGTPIAKPLLKPGDIVFFKNTYKRGVSHVGIYIGRGRFIHAAGTGQGTIVSSLSEPKWIEKYAGARRLVRNR